MQAVSLQTQIAEEKEHNHILQQEKKNLEAKMSKTEEYRKNQVLDNAM